MSPVCFVGDIIRYWGGEAVVLDYKVESTGLSELLLIYDIKYSGPFVIEPTEVKKLEFKDASPLNQYIAQALLFHAKSKEYFHR